MEKIKVRKCHYCNKHLDKDKTCDCAYSFMIDVNNLNSQFS